MVGKTLGHYEILEPLGAGGMGQVYRAHDTNLKRDVAIKVLPEELAADDARLARLEREAHLLASLNHPNVAAIYNLEESDGVRWLVLELVEGENLEQRLRSGSLPLEDALATGRQVAVALDAAHKQGIVHRDLKPANVMLGAEGVVKVLDFGIAKAPLPASGDGSDQTGNAKSRERFPGTQAVTSAAAQLTATGMLVGTAPYMSPEQIRGQNVDKRSDIWAFGCLMFELLSGQRPFHGETMADTLIAILEREPDWDTLPADTPPSVRELIQRCLRKDADMRLQDIADGRVAIDDAPRSGTIPAMARPGSSLKPRFRISKQATAGVVGLLLIGTMFIAYQMRWGQLFGDAWPDTLRISRADNALAAYPLIATGIAELIEQEIGISVQRMDPSSIGGVAENLRRIDAGELDLALVQNDAAFRAVETNDLLGYKSGNITGLAALYPELLQAIVRRDSGITTIEDLRGKTIALGRGFSVRSSVTLLSQFDIDETDFVQGPSVGRRALQDGDLGSVDAVMEWASVPTMFVEGAFRAGVFTLVSIDPDVAAGLQASSPFFQPATIPPRAYPRQVEEVPTVAVMAMLAANSQLPDDLVERILEVMFANIPYLVAKHPRAQDISLQTAFGVGNGMSIPLHPGAERFREAHTGETSGRQ